MIVTMLNEKGGVGKSTIADEIFSSFERTGVSVALINTDAQYGDAVRGDASSAEVVIVDTPGTLPDNVDEMVAASDLIVVPTRPTARNVEPTCRVLTRVHDVDPYTPVLVVLVGTTTRGVAGARFATWLKDWLKGEGYEGHVSMCGIPHSEAFGAAEMAGVSVIELVRSNSSRYAREVGPSLTALVNHVRELGGYEREEL